MLTSLADIISYDEVKAAIVHAQRVGANASTVSTSNDGLRLMDCALRTQLTQLSIIIGVESRKYDTVFLEYERVRRIMEDRKLSSAEYLPIQ